MSLKNKLFERKLFERKLKRTDDFRAFKTKMLTRTLCMAALAAVCVGMLYSFFFQGRFANCIVAIYQKLFQMDFEEARNLYQRTVRNYIEWYYLLAILLMFAVIFRIYLKWFTRYFEEIDRGMNCLIQENAGEISLSHELLPIERKMNSIKHTIERQKRERAAEEQRKNDLVMYLAHDLKTPLASVIGYLNLLHDERQISEELRERYLSVALDKAERLEDLTNEFFEIAKFSLSSITLQYSRINLTRLLEMLLYEFQPMLKEKNLSCNLSAAEDLMLCCDADKIQRVFDNLLWNAVAYSYEGTAIDIRADRQGQGVEIHIVNRGDAIPEEKLERIFEQFYRLDTSRGTGGGAGLGLAIAKQIVELHKGTVTARSGEGETEFVVVLPELGDDYPFGGLHDPRLVSTAS